MGKTVVKKIINKKPTAMPTEIYKTYQNDILKLQEMNPKKLEKEFTPIAENLLEYLGFMHVQNANEISNYRNPPFDFFGVLDGKPYMIEFKGSLNEFNSPGETQKRRLQELKLKVPTLHVALLQVAIIGGKKNKGEYRLLLDDEMDHLFPGYQIPLDKLENWITEQIKEYCPGVKPA
jgi:hypothetical protein